MFGIYRIAQWTSLLAILLTAVAAVCAFRWSGKRAYLFLLLASLGFTVAPTTPWVLRTLERLTLSEQERAQQEALMEEVLAVNEKYDPVPYVHVPFILRLPFGQVFLLFAALHFAAQERKSRTQSNANNGVQSAFFGASEK